MRRGLPIRTDTYLVGEHLIWGATARILADLLDRVGVLLELRLLITPERSAGCNTSR